MSQLLAKITTDLTTHLKNGDRIAVGTLRFLIAQIKNSAIASYGNESDTKLTDEDVLIAIKKQIKSRRESIDAFTKAQRTDLAAKEQAELAILETYAPAQLTNEQLMDLLKPVVSTGEKNFGLLMKQAVAVVAGQAEGGRVAAILKQMLS